MSLMLFDAHTVICIFRLPLGSYMTGRLGVGEMSRKFEIREMSGNFLFLEMSGKCQGTCFWLVNNIQNIKNNAKKC